MKKIIYFLLVLSLVACDDLSEYMDNLNNAPFIDFIDSTHVIDGILKDSVKTSEHSLNKYLEIKLSLSDPDNNLKEVGFFITAGSGKLYRDGLEVTGTIPVTEDRLAFTYEPSTLGKNELTFFAIDAFGAKSNNIFVEMTAFENLSPKAVLTTNKIAFYSPLEYELDASQSFDKDKRFGGAISLYKFEVNGQNVNIASSKIKYIFPTAGRYMIGLTVVDNDGFVSERVEKYIDVN